MKQHIGENVQLQPLNGEKINGLIGDNAKPDIRTRGILRDGQNRIFEVRITNTNCNSQKHLSVETILRKKTRTTTATNVNSPFCINVF